jgi:hypothetical protein
MCRLFGITPATLNSVVKRSKVALNLELGNMIEARISWPTIMDQQREFASLDYIVTFL